MSLVLGLLGLAVLPIVFSLPAIWLSMRARREIAHTPGLYGENAAGWGLALGIFGTGIGLLLVGAFTVGWYLPR
jgi:hypothetical protein